MSNVARQVPEDSFELSMIRQSARDFAARHARKKGAWLRDVADDYIEEIRRLGWLAMFVPEQYGGLDLDFKTMAALVEELGRGLVAEPLVAIAVLGTRSLVLGDKEVLKERLLPRCVSGDELPALAWQELRGEYDPGVVSTRASLESGDWRIDGGKNFILGAGMATGFVVSARTDSGIALFWIDRHAAGVELSFESRVDGSKLGILKLTGVVVPAGNMVASAMVGHRVLEQALDEAVVMTSVEAYGVLSAALDVTLAFMRARVQFDRPIGTFQALQHRAVDLYLLQQLTSAAVGEAVEAMDATSDSRERSIAASRAKCRSSMAGLKVGKESIQLHGAIGYTDEYIIGHHLKRLLVLSAVLGNAGTHRTRLRALGLHLKDDTFAAAPPLSLGSPSSAEPGSQDWNDMDDAEFRESALRFFDEHCPRSLRFMPNRPRWDEVREWYSTLSRKGWLAPGLPREYGGMGLAPGKLLIYFEAAAMIGLPRLHDQGINQVAPILIARGTQAQRKAFIPKIISGDHVWCQGYSEPDAGSDLAALRTQARLEGEYFIVNGQKTWTSMAHDATHMYALVRTDRSAKKQKGISFLLIDLDQPGVTIRPIKNLTGDDEFCEVFLDDVRTHCSNLVGEMNDGWSVAKSLLGFERTVAGSPRRCFLMLNHLHTVARHTGKIHDAVFADLLAQLELDVLDLSALYERLGAKLRGGGLPGSEVSGMKILATETLQRLTDLLVSAVDDAGGLYGEQTFGAERIDVLAHYFTARPFTIFGGSNEIQRNIIATRVLGLPKEDRHG
ncbi:MULTISPECIES: acyl-CoA dehydrogenase [unclassified Pigmentiphaga]|uniref:acyl-CoA dehydrogenase n=1 Tax=unclassified Pigmentiphaga TaxID=2626614 RepID=UPI000B422BA3|nr:MULTISPECIES: acyl-CoA dehydrogenase [unclassified Pigmentiphaga]OVZ66443.1 hypothetical protein CDO46_00760 [Pigmentiphaga sp. NML030171]